jgi:hypothetical protein
VDSKKRKEVSCSPSREQEGQQEHGDRSEAAKRPRAPAEDNASACQPTGEAGAGPVQPESSCSPGLARCPADSQWRAL